jgi:uncharacterized protein (DUF2141 family)
MRRLFFPLCLAIGLAGSTLAGELPATPTVVPTPALADLQPELPLQSGPVSAQGRLIVRIQKIRNPRGNVWVSLFSGPAGFPDLKQARQVSVARRTSNYAEAVFTGLPYGDYALGAYHDEDNNLKLTKNWLGKNLEGMGVSNNPQKVNYQNARFALDAPELRLLIDLVYPGSKTGGGN